MKTSAMLTIRSAICGGIVPSTGKAAASATAAIRKSAGAGMKMRELRRFDSTAATIAAATKKTATPNGTMSIMCAPLQGSSNRIADQSSRHTLKRFSLRSQVFHVELRRHSWLKLRA